MSWPAEITAMAAQLVIIEAIVIKYHENNENGCIIFAVVCPPKPQKGMILYPFKKNR